VAEILTLEVQGIPALLANLEKLASGQQVAIGRGLFRWGEEVMAEAKGQLVPVDTGVLRASGFVMTRSLRDVPPGAVPSPEAVAAMQPRTADDVAAVLGFGGPAAPYALAVHENPRSGKTGGISPQGKRYKHFARVGQWKYLETAVKNHAGRLAEVVATEVRVFVQQLGQRGRTR
jgi:hypothetical protein